MKSILLASASVFAFAGAAAAEITFSGEATLGYNDTALAGTKPAADSGLDEAGTWEDNEFGFYSDLSVTIRLAVDLDNGLKAAASIDLEDLAGGATSADYELSLTSETAGLYYGDTGMAAASKFSEVGDMGIDFSKTDGEVVLRGEVAMGGIEGALSYIIDDEANALEQLSVGVAATFGNFDVALGYQAAVSGTAPQALGDVTAPANFNSDKTMLASGYVAGTDFNPNELFGLSIGTSFAGADVSLGYVSDQTANNDAYGVSISYPVGPVTLSASYANNSATGDAWDLGVDYEDGPIAVSASYDESDNWAIEGSYDVGNGLMVLAGVVDAGDAYYVAGTYDLGSGASLLVSFADDTASGAEDEIGAGGYQEGTTVELSFAF